MLNFKLRSTSDKFHLELLLQIYNNAFGREYTWNIDDLKSQCWVDFVRLGSFWGLTLSFNFRQHLDILPVDMNYIGPLRKA